MAKPEAQEGYTKNLRLRPDFTSVNYWDERFKDEDSYDWLVKYHEISDILREHLKKEDKILMLGRSTPLRCPNPAGRRSATKRFGGRGYSAA